MKDNPVANSTAPGWRELRDEARDERRAGRSGAWVFGLIFVVVGILLLLQNYNIAVLHNWWALFILIPAFGSLAGAWHVFQNNGSIVSGAVLGPALSGLVLLAVAAIFLFEWTVDWGLLGPLVLILIGVSVLASGLFASRAGRA